jgi:hypothetical protein
MKAIRQSLSHRSKLKHTGRGAGMNSQSKAKKRKLVRVKKESAVKKEKKTTSDMRTTNSKASRDDTDELEFIGERPVKR